jgi:hypothetical protein
VYLICIKGLNSLKALFTKRAKRAVARFVHKIGKNVVKYCFHGIRRDSASHMTAISAGAEEVEK